MLVRCFICALDLNDYISGFNGEGLYNKICNIYGLLTVKILVRTMGLLQMVPFCLWNVCNTYDSRRSFLDLRFQMDDRVQTEYFKNRKEIHGLPISHLYISLFGSNLGFSNDFNLLLFIVLDYCFLKIFLIFVIYDILCNSMD